MSMKQFFCVLSQATIPQCCYLKSVWSVSRIVVAVDQIYHLSKLHFIDNSFFKIHFTFTFRQRILHISCWDGFSCCFLSSRWKIRPIAEIQSVRQASRARTCRSYEQGFVSNTRLSILTFYRSSGAPFGKEERQKKYYTQAPCRVSKNYPVDCVPAVCSWAVVSNLAFLKLHVCRVSKLHSLSRRTSEWRSEVTRWRRKSVYVKTLYLLILNIMGTAIQKFCRKCSSQQRN